MSDVGENFIKPLLLQFILPNTAKEGQEAAFYQDYQEALSEFTSHELEHAAKLLKTTRTSRTFPVIADCLEACKHARDALQPPAKRRHGSDAEKYPEWSPERQRMADRMICGEMGRKAAEEGWLIALWDFCRHKERLPNRFEAEKVAKKSRKNWKVVDEIISDMIQNGKDATIALSAKRSMQKRFQDLKAKVYAKQEAA